MTAHKIPAKPKIVQGTWIPKEDYHLLQAEAEKNEMTGTAFASLILTEWCAKKRVDLATETLGGLKKKERSDDGEKEIGTGNTETQD